MAARPEDGLITGLPGLTSPGATSRPAPGIQPTADRTDVPYIDGRKVPSHSWRAGANTDMICGGRPAEGAQASRWADGSHTADTVYDRTHRAGGATPSTPCLCMAVRQCLCGCAVAVGRAGTAQPRLHRSVGGMRSISARYRNPCRAHDPRCLRRDGSCVVGGVHGGQAP